MDEVLAVGDAAFQKKCLGKMGEVAKEGRTILLVSHNLPYITHVSTRALLISEGRLISDDTSATVIDQYTRIDQHNMSAGELSFDTSERLTNGDLSVPRVEILSENGDPLTSLAGGQHVRLRIHYQCSSPLVSPSFMIAISSSGIEILRLSTLPISGFHLPELRGKGYVDCILKGIPLTGGVYTLGVGVGRPNVEYLILDKEVGTFEVPAFDAYGSGFGVDRRCGVMVASHKWELNQA